MSICIYCGQDHAATVRTCPKTGKAIGAAQSTQKTLFGVGAAILPPVEQPVPKDLPSVAVSLPPPKPVPAGNQTSSLALGKTMFGVAPAPKQAPEPSRVPPLPFKPATIPPRMASALRLPTEQEARDNPDLVISLDLTPAPSPKREPVATSVVRPEAMFADTPIDLPSVVEPLPPNREDRTGARDVNPTDLPPVGQGKRFVLPEPKTTPANGQPQSQTGPSRASALLADTRSVQALFRWAIATYLRRPKPLFLLAALLLLPASVVQSCALASIAPTAPVRLDVRATTVDLSNLKAELAARVRASEQRGEMDKEAAAELAALTSVEATHVPAGLPPVSGSVWLWSALALFVQGLILLGLAFPLACGVLAIAAVDELRGAKPPTFSDLWPVLLARGELFLVSLVPAAMLIALGYALFVVPGLCASVLFLFLPHVVLFEKKDGRVALSRSIELVRRDITRVLLAFLAFTLAAFVVALLTKLAFSVSDSRAVMFLRFLTANLVTVAIFPIPALVFARLYADSRARTGAAPERLAQAARV